MIKKQSNCEKMKQPTLREVYNHHHEITTKTYVSTRWVTHMCGIACTTIFKWNKDQVVKLNRNEYGNIDYDSFIRIVKHGVKIDRLKCYLILKEIGELDYKR